MPGGQPKRLLIIQATSDDCCAEVNQLKSICGMFGMESQFIKLEDTWDIYKKLMDLGESQERIDYIYLAAHANTQFFGESNSEKIKIPWEELGYAICDGRFLNQGSILMLGCCRGGLKEVAIRLFCACSEVDYVCGPRWTVRPADITVGFHVFMYNMLVRTEQPSTSVKRASKATNYEFFCHDRVELQDEILKRAEEIELCKGDQREEA